MDLSLKVTSDFAPEKQLRGHLLTLSQSLSPCLVEKMTTYLCHTRTITDHEVGVITSQPTVTQKASHLIQIVLRKGRNACLQFYQCLGQCHPDLCEKITGYTVGKPSKTADEQPSRNDIFTVKSGDHIEKSTSQFCFCPGRKSTHHASPYIINIHNSTLSHCIIGNQSSQVISTEAEHLVAEGQDVNLQETVRTSLMYGQQGEAEVCEEPNQLKILDSQMEYVIIGNHSSMVINTTQSEEVEEEEGEEYHNSCDG